MTTVETSIEVVLPLKTVYNQWTQFEEFPMFMEGVESVTQITDDRLHWVASIGGVRREWDAQITKQEPDKIISWETIDGATNSGNVMFEELDTARTQVTLRVEFDPEGLVEKAGDTLGIWQRRVEGDVERFKDFLEERGMETGGWRGEIEGGRTVKLDEDRTVEVDPDSPRERSEFPVDRGTTAPPRRE